MRKVISYSLWGDSKLYCQGAIENVYHAEKWYPDWTLRFYVAQDCPALSALQNMGVETVVMPPMEGIDRTLGGGVWHDQDDHVAMMWRFMAIDDCDTDYVIFRDTDSRLNPREASAVKDWIESGKVAHRMHEVPAHWNAVVMGGMWGIKGGQLHPNLKIAHMIERYMSPGGFDRLGEPKIFVDLYFIRDLIWPRIKHSCLGHGHAHALPFPCHEPWSGKVGEVVNEEWRKETYVPL